jgi:CubicO group peptidase (beta-lactamase class C family)
MIKSKIFLTLFSGSLLFFSMASLSSEFDSLDAFITDVKQQTEFSYGTSVALIKDGQVVFKRHYGYSNIVNKQKVTDDTLFYIASVTKPLYAMTTLLNQKTFGYDENTNMQDMFPTLQLNGVNKSEVNVKSLLAHTSGLSNNNLITATAYTGIHSPESINTHISNSKLDANHTLGHFNYSNIGYNITSHWMTQTFGKAWQKVMADSVFRPLEMNNTTAYMSEAISDNKDIASPYWIYNDPPSTSLYLSKKDNTMHAAGGVISTTTDLSKYLLALMNGGKVNDKQVLPKTIVEKSLETLAMFEPKERTFLEKAYGWGWFIGTHDNHKIYSHLGGFSGAHAHVSFIPSQGVGLIVLNNEGHISRGITKQLAQIAYGLLLDKPLKNNVIAEMRDATVAKHHKLAKLLSAEKKRKAKRPWLLSLEKNSYAGTYQNDLFGEVIITVDSNDKMNIRWGNLNAIAAPHKYRDVARVELVPGRGWRVTFNLSETASISGLTLEQFSFKKVSQHTNITVGRE